MASGRAVLSTYPPGYEARPVNCLENVYAVNVATWCKNACVSY